MQKVDPVEAVVDPELQLQQPEESLAPVLDLYVPMGQPTGPVRPGQ